MSDYFLSNDLLSELDAIPAKSVVSKTILKGGDMNAIVFGFASGEELSEHTAARPAVLHFLKGRAKVILAGDEMELESGAWAFMPANMPHSIEALEEVVMLLLMV